MITIKILYIHIWCTQDRRMQDLPRDSVTYIISRNQVYEERDYINFPFDEQDSCLLRKQYMKY